MWLIGMMGSGKSTVGERAAVALGVPFYDTDALVEETAGMTIVDIWRAHGEKRFRELEAAAIETVPGDGVAAAGGGAVTVEANRDVIARSGVVVWLQCEPEGLAERVGSIETRPLLTGDGDPLSTLRRLLDERAPLYSALSTHQIDTTRRPLDEVVSDVVSLWPH